MRGTRLDRRWLLGAVVAVCLCALSIIAARASSGDAVAREVFNGLAWLSAIAVAFCLVRSGVDAGVRHHH